MRTRFSFDPIVHGGLQADQANRLRLGGNRGRLIYAATDVPPAVSALPGAAFAPAVLEALDTYVNGMRQLAGLRPLFSLVISYCAREKGDPYPCNAMASMTDGFLGHPLSFLIQMNVDAIPELHKTAGELFDDPSVALALDPALAAERAAVGDAAWLNQCVLVAALMLFFHELAHVVRGHLVLLDTKSLDEGDRTADVDLFVRRIAEVDADFFGAMCLATLLRQLAGPAVPDRERWYTWALAGCFVMFLSHAKTSQLPNSIYHAPLVRFHTLRLALARPLGLSEQDSDARLARFYGAMKTSAAADPMLGLKGRGLLTLDSDLADWRKTEKHRVALQRDGAFDVLWASPPSAATAS